MRLTRATGAILAAALLAGGSAAAAPAADPLRRGGLLIERAPLGELAFSVRPDGALVHLQSGMVCAQAAGDARLSGLEVYDESGEDVGCSYVLPYGTLSLYATRADPRPMDQRLLEAVWAMRASNAGMQPVEAPFTPSEPGVSQVQAAAFATRDGTAITAVWLAQEHDWIIKVRATYAPDSRRETERVAGDVELRAQQSVKAAY